MVAVADASWRSIASEAWADLQPFPGRFAMTWRVALLCALFAGVAMVYRIPESAIGCYLIIFLARPDGAECVGQAIGVIVLASLVVLIMVPVINATADSALVRLIVIAAVSFVFVYLGAASQLGEQGSIVALVVAFVLTLIDHLPVGQIATHGLLYAWQMACVPMAMTIVFNLVLGTSPQRLMREMVRQRLEAAAKALQGHGMGDGTAIRAALAKGNAEVGKHVMLGGVFHTAPAATMRWLQGAAMNSYRILLAVAALPPCVPEEARATLARRCRDAANAVGRSGRPQAQSASADTGPPALDAANAALDELAQDNGGTDVTSPGQPFFAPDALTNPDYQRYALKVTAAAISCYLIYSIINWQGIHTAMITCYVAALGNTAETIHKLALRIIGCLVGAGIGFFSILFVIPHLESVGGLMALVFGAIIIAAWVSSGSERISYAGVQIGLAFLLTVLNGFSPSLSMSSGRDRVFGILLGNIVVYLFFTHIWPKGAAVEVNAKLKRMVEALARLASFGDEARASALAEAEIIETQAQAACEQLHLLPFEPAAERPSPERIQAAFSLVEEIRELLPQVMFSVQLPADASPRLGAVAMVIAGKGRSARGQAPEGSATAGDITVRIERIERLAGRLAA